MVYYFRLEQRTPVRCTEDEWRAWVASGARIKRVSHIGSERVETIFVGFRRSDQEPLWRTVVYGSHTGQVGVAYTADEANAKHDEAVLYVRAEVAKRAEKSPVG